eukprot:SAG11_NODE_1239_length_5424_cov_8.855399_2_plen_226_part_00
MSTYDAPYHHDGDMIRTVMRCTTRRCHENNSNNQTCNAPAASGRSPRAHWSLRCCRRGQLPFRVIELHVLPCGLPVAAPWAHDEALWRAQPQLRALGDEFGGSRAPCAASCLPGMARCDGLRAAPVTLPPPWRCAATLATARWLAPSTTSQCADTISRLIISLRRRYVVDAPPAAAWLWAALWWSGAASTRGAADPRSAILGVNPRPYLLQHAIKRPHCGESLRH